MSVSVAPLTAMACWSSRLQQASLVPASLLLPTMVRLRMVVPELLCTWRPFESEPDVPVRFSRAPLPSSVMLRLPLTRTVLPSRYVPPALNTMVEPLGASLMNDCSAELTSLEPVASIDEGVPR